jgi:hypothetical protein
MKVGPCDEDFQPPKNCVEEYVLDEISYNSHLKHYHEENKRLQDEFRRDLIEYYGMTGHPKADKIFNKAWDMGCSLGYEAIQEYFEDFVELFKNDERNEVFLSDTYLEQCNFDFSKRIVMETNLHSLIIPYYSNP